MVTSCLSRMFFSNVSPMLAEILFETMRKLFPPIGCHRDGCFAGWHVQPEMPRCRSKLRLLHYESFLCDSSSLYIALNPSNWDLRATVHCGDTG